MQLDNLPPVFLGAGDPPFQVFQVIQELAVGDANGPWTRTGPLSVASKDWTPKNSKFMELFFGMSKSAFFVRTTKKERPDGMNLQQ